MPRRPLIACNWKMHALRPRVGELTAAAREMATQLPGIDVLLCPGFTLLGEVAAALEGSRVHLGGQDCSASQALASTGQVSAAMLLEYGASHALIGHSERRAMCGEDDAAVAAKVCAALDAGLAPVLCVGETAAEREAGETAAVLTRQLGAVLTKLPTPLPDIVIAYEPVWAIGSGQAASPETAQEAHALLRTLLAQHDSAASVPLLYGGSVQAENARDLLRLTDVDGALLGGAGLKTDQFSAICAQAANSV